MSEDVVAGAGSDRQLRFSIRLVVRHPTMDPMLITKELGLTPHLSHFAGAERMTPANTKLPGKYRESIWGWAQHLEGKRAFFDNVSELAIRLRKHQDFIAGLMAGGGSIVMIVDLPGDVNIGSVLSSVNIKRLADLGVDLGIEVFPEWSNID